jgi:hypothetical protein
MMKKKRLQPGVFLFARFQTSAATRFCPCENARTGHVARFYPFGKSERTNPPDFVRSENPKRKMSPDFAKLMSERYAEVAGQTPYRMTTARKETDKYYHAIVNQLENQLLAGNHIADALIGEMNAVFERFKRILAQEISERIPTEKL